MRHLRLSILVVLVLLGGPAVPRIPSRDDMVVKHKWDVIPDDWHSLGPPPDDTTIDLNIALQPNQKDALTNVLFEVSQPGHPKYGAHLSIEQVAELVAPHPNTLILVTTWLEHNGVPTSSISTTLAGGWLVVADVPVSQANKILGASYHLYYHAGMNDTILRTAGYALPAALHVHVKTVVPTTAFTSTRLLQQTSRGNSGEAMAPNVTSGESVNMLSRDKQLEQNITPSVLRSMYKTETYEPILARTGNRLGIVGSENEHPDLGDLSAFLKEFRSGAISQTVDFKPIDQNMGPGHRSGRANLFTQYAGAIAFPTPIDFYVGTNAWEYSAKKRKRSQGDDVVLQFLKYTVGRQDIPQTIALMMEGTKETSVSKDYAESVCKQFEILGAGGVTVLVASGNGGVGAGHCREFYINFPASCPYVTVVGGTTGIPPAAEVAYPFSGGGFSKVFDALKYQKPHVGKYVDSIGNMHRGLYRPWGRAIPDIALASSRYIYNSKGQVIQMDGTSCSTSTAVAIFSLLNDYRLFLGMKPFGFANPWIYGLGGFGFTDITSGNNPGCGSRGFDAKAGWDPVTGQGSPDVSLLIDIIELESIRQPPQPQRRNQSLHNQP